MQKRHVIICSYLVKVLPTFDQFDNLYVKHNISNLGDENSLKYLLTGPVGKYILHQIFHISFIYNMYLMIRVCVAVWIKVSGRFRHIPNWK